MVSAITTDIPLKIRNNQRGTEHAEFLRTESQRGFSCYFFYLMGGLLDIWIRQHVSKDCIGQKGMSEA